LEISEEIAREAGALLHGYFERHIGFELKGEFDLVREADRASERLVIERLQRHFPTHSIVAEESGGHAGQSAEYCWYVDPLDGTTNFAHGFPIYNVTLAQSRRDCGWSDFRSRARRNVHLRAGIGVARVAPRPVQLVKR
jgi:myo-inositol-1(or 4)-monophosphatase